MKGLMLLLNTFLKNPYLRIVHNILFSYAQKLIRGIFITLRGYEYTNIYDNLTKNKQSL